jgi:hypothetical protein
MNVIATEVEAGECVIHLHLLVANHATPAVAAALATCLQRLCNQCPAMSAAEIQAVASAIHLQLINQSINQSINQTIKQRSGGVWRCNEATQWCSSTDGV